MAKKSKDKQKQPHNETSNSSDIFNTLFGATPTDSSIASLFSDENPFKRKPNDNPTATQEPKLGVQEASVENQTDGVSGSNDSGTAELKKRKKKDKKVDLNSGSVAEEVSEEEGGKSKRLDLSGTEESNGVVSDSGKKKKDKKVTFGSESVDEEGNNLKRVDFSRIEESNDGISDSRNIESLGFESKKKRKRDEIEAEYEANRYGVVAMEEVEKRIGEMIVGEKRKKMDNPEDMMVSNDGFDDESKLLRTIFVGNLPLKIKKKALLKEFGSFGEIESVRIRSIPVADVSVSYLFFASMYFTC